ncbi:HVO_2922 family protein [Halomarina pelagica]|uniref:HVO_2922 family protein n=1 Tax=Halomarina pelagica TaxID=2961599 RepID=UPI0020C1F066|nr:HVO_2922 family protein [Halomarina sp. BND7]
MDERTRVSVTVDVALDEGSLGFATTAVEEAVADLVGDGVAGEVRVAVARDGASPSATTEPTGAPEGAAASESTDVLSAEGDGTERTRRIEPDELSRAFDALAEREAFELPLADAQASFEVYSDRAGRWRWRLVHDNGNIIADSGGSYASRYGAVQGIRSVKRNVPGAAVESR